MAERAVFLCLVTSPALERAHTAQLEQRAGAKTAVVAVKVYESESNRYHATITRLGHRGGGLGHVSPPSQSYSH